MDKRHPKRPLLKLVQTLQALVRDVHRKNDFVLVNTLPPDVLKGVLGINADIILKLLPVVRINYL